MIRTAIHKAGEPGVAQPFADLVLDRPDKRNALTPEMLRALTTAAIELDADPEVRAIAIWGEGKTFCAGFDLELCVDDDSALPALLTELANAIRVIRRCDTPVILGVHGGAIAGGAALLAAADLVIADPSAKIGYPVTLLGLSPAVSAPTLERATSTSRARAMLLDPRVQTAEALHPNGPVHVLTGLPEDVVPQTQLHAQRLAEKAPGAYAATKRWLNEIDGTDTDTVLDQALAASLATAGTEEQKRLLESIWNA